MDASIKPFACGIKDCVMSFINEDHLHVHRKKHDMVLQLGTEQKSAFIADQTPTPTRFIRNCEEVGLFQELQNVNPFDEGFKKAIETRTGLDNSSISVSSDDILHTPQMVFPELVENSEGTNYSSINKINIVISRSSSDDTGIVRQFATTTISKGINEISESRNLDGHGLEKHKADDDVAQGKGLVNETVSYTNNITKIKSMEVGKSDVLAKESTQPNVNVLSPKNAPIMSQKSLDDVVNSLSCGVGDNDMKDVRLINTLKKNFKRTFQKSGTDPKGGTQSWEEAALTRTNLRFRPNVKRKRTSADVVKSDVSEDYEVLIKLPTGKCVRMKAVTEVDDRAKEIAAKQLLNRVIKEKTADRAGAAPAELQAVKSMTVTPIKLIPQGALIPITILHPGNGPVFVSKPTANAKVPIPAKVKFARTCAQKVKNVSVQQKVSANKDGAATDSDALLDRNDDETGIDKGRDKGGKERTSNNASGFGYHEIRNAASKRYRDKLKKERESLSRIVQEMSSSNLRLMQENARLKALLIKHMKKCPMADDLRDIQKALNMHQSDMTRGNS